MSRGNEELQDDRATGIYSICRLVFVFPTLLRAKWLLEVDPVVDASLDCLIGRVFRGHPPAHSDVRMHRRRKWARIRLQRGGGGGWNLLFLAARVVGRAESANLSDFSFTLMGESWDFGVLCDVTT